MNKEDIAQLFATAKELVSGVEERYRSLALEVVFQRLLDQSVGVTQAAGPGPVPVVGPQVALNEFLASAKPKSHTDRVLRIAQYYLRYRNRPVSRAEVAEAYTLGRMSRPQNLSDVIGKAIGKGYVMEVPGPEKGERAFQITQSGEKYLEGQAAKA